MHVQSCCLYKQQVTWIPTLPMKVAFPHQQLQKIVRFHLNRFRVGDVPLFQLMQVLNLRDFHQHFLTTPIRRHHWSWKCPSSSWKTAEKFETMEIPSKQWKYCQHLHKREPFWSSGTFKMLLFLTTWAVVYFNINIIGDELLLNFGARC